MRRSSKIGASLVVGAGVLLMGFQNCMQAKPLRDDGSATEASLAAQALSEADGPCQNWSANTSAFQQVPSGAVLSGEVSGFYQLRGPVRLANASGSVAILAGEGGSLESVANFTGTLYLCGVDVGSIANVDLNRATLVGGSVGKILGAKGTLVLKGVDVRGEIASPELRVIR